ncbi:MAG: hypothetical protein EA398_14015 [Deltaproteobacteria bacterium]|nr:MAG: hypothetical protein EA398_14015 [Deltaproteobacteria bacterium]
MSSTPQTTDVLILGAGASGLHAADILRRAGRTVRVLEARSRIGGRIETVSADDGTALDVGGQWLSRDHVRAIGLVRRFRIPTFPQPCDGTKLLEIGGRISRHQGDIPQLPIWSLLDLQQAISRLERLARRIPVDSPWLAHDAHALDTRSAEDWIRNATLTDDARECLRAAVRAIHACEPRDISMLQLLWYAHGNVSFMKLATIRDGAQDIRMTRGAISLLQPLADSLHDAVVTDAAVVAIDQDAEGVAARLADGRSFSARRLICSLAPPQAADIAFAPALPSRRIAVHQRMTMGSVIKCIALYDRPFWRDDGLSGEVVSDDCTVQLAFDETVPGSDHGALVAFVNGDAARRWTRAPAPDRRDAVLRSLARWFGERAGHPIAFVERNWPAEPFSRGCYVAQFGPGGWLACGDALRQPCGRIHWAGTETATVFPGYIEGALEAAERATHEVLGACA